MPLLFVAMLVNRYTVGLVIVLLMLSGAYYKGYHNAAGECHDAALTLQIANLQRDIDNAAKADKLQQQLQADLKSQNDQLQQKVTDYETDLAARPVDTRCVLDQRDVERLRGIGHH